MKNYAVADYITGKDIKRVRSKLGLTQKDFANFVKVSTKTVERWETSETEITGPIVLLVKILEENLQIEENLVLTERKLPLRMLYMYHQLICACIDIDEQKRIVQVKNYTKNYLFRPFGREEQPSFEQYEEFLESRCFPRSRDKMKLALKELDLPFYDPLMIIEKTQGRMAEDDFWIQIKG